MEVITKTNGYKISEELNAVIEQFEKVAQERLSDIKKIDHFYYGDKLSMSDIVLESGHYGQFNITAKRVSFGGHTCSREERDIFESLTWNDELFKGKLYE
jgi:hypothetical protein